MEHVMPGPLCGVVPLVALAALAACWLWRQRKVDAPAATAADNAWAAVAALPLAAFACLGFAGLLDSLPASVVCSAILWACGAAAMHRHDARAWFARKPAAARIARDAVLLAAATACAALAMELPWNTELAHIDLRLFAHEALVIGLVLAALYFLGRRHGALVAIGVAACMLVGLSEYFVLLFRGVVFLPRDLYALETAASVAGNYRYSLYASAMAGITAACIGVACCSLLQPEHPARLGTAGSWAATVAVGALVAFAGVHTLAAPAYEDELGVKLDYWYITQGFQSQGFIPTFMAAVQDLEIQEPRGYSTQAAQAALDQHASDYSPRESSARKAARKQFDEVKPSVVAVMNESFTDLSVLGDLGCGYQGPQFFNSADNGAAAQGKVAVSAFGGGTANTEFEFLTGCSLATIGSGKYPFQTYHLDGVESLARQFAEQGYRTCGMHPNHSGNWKRKTAYPELGFDTSLFIEDFEGAETFHNGVSDTATYDKILEVLSSSDEPQFVFDVTMQNHSGYKTGNTPADQMRPVSIDGYDDEFNYQVAEYLACIDESDRALREFVGKLRELDRPVVLVFFGDHHPLFSREVNDAAFPNEASGAGHLQRIQQTVYGIWANYDIAGSGGGDGGALQGDVSASTLGGYALQLIGAPLTLRQEAMLALRRDMPQYDVFGYEDADGGWHWPGDDSPAAAAWRDALFVDYLTCASRLR